MRRHRGARGGRSPDAVTLTEDPSLALPLGGARQILGALRLRLGDDIVDAALAPQRALLSLSLRGLVGSLDAAERRTREHESALFLAMLPGTGLSARPVLEAWADVAPLLAQAPLALLIPDAARVDPGSLALLRPLLRRLDPAARPAVLIGFPTDAKPMRDAIDQRVAEINADEIGRLRALPGVAFEEPTEVLAGSAASTDGPVAWHPLDDRLELRAAGRLGSPVDRDLVLAAARASFASFGFATALRLAEALLAADADDPAGAELHTLAFLAAVHLAPPRSADHPLARRADVHLLAAFARETDPARRAHLLFRRCIRTARGGDLAAARDFGDQGVAVAAGGAGVTPARAALLGAWCRNARAYASFRAGRATEAAEDCIAALAALAGCDDPGDVPAVEVQVARFHVLNNLTRLAFEAGDRAAAARWQDLSLASEEAIPPRRRTSFRWYDLDLDLGDLDLAAERYAARQRDARAQWDLGLVALYGHDLATIHQRRGDAEASLACFAEVFALAPRLDWDAEDRFNAGVNVAVAAFRAGRYALALAGFEDALEDPVARDPEVAAALRGALSTVAAHRADAPRASAEAALALAASEGTPPEARARVLRSVGDTWACLGRPAAARRAYEAALDLARDNPLAPEDTLGLLLGRREAGCADHAVVDAALALALPALADANAWWDLPRLLRALVEVAAEGFFAADPSARTDAARALVRAAGRRLDARVLAALLDAG